MIRLRENALFTWEHPSSQIVNGCICFHNIRSWNKHIQHFCSNRSYAKDLDIICFAETNLRNQSFERIDKYLKGWRDIHITSEHGLPVCYNPNKVKVIRQLDLICPMEMLPVILEVRQEKILLVVIYRTGTLRNFVNDILENLNTFPKTQRMVIVGDFNLDQMLDTNVQYIQPLLTEFKLTQRSNYTTHIHGGILDLVFDSSKNKDVLWMPSPYSDHFVLFAQLFS